MVAPGPDGRTDGRTAGPSHPSAPQGATTMQSHYHRDATTGRIVLTGLSKADYQALPEADRADVKRYFRFSRDREAWIAKGATYMPEQIAKRLGLTDGGVEEGDEALTFAEQQARTQERAAGRAERREGYAEKAQKSADRLYEAGMNDLRQIPFGQPIQPVGHHSHNRDKAFRAKAVSKVERSFEETKRARHHEEQAAVARVTAEAAHLSDPAFLARRIREHEAELRRLDREIAKAQQVGYRDRLEARKAKEEEKIAYYRARLEDVGGTLFTADSLKGAEAVRDRRGRWSEVVSIGRVNVKITAYGSAYPIPITDVTGARFPGGETVTNDGPAAPLTTDPRPDA